MTGPRLARELLLRNAQRTLAGPSCGPVEHGSPLLGRRGLDYRRLAGIRVITGHGGSDICARRRRDVGSSVAQIRIGIAAPGRLRQGDLDMAFLALFSA